MFRKALLLISILIFSNSLFAQDAVLTGTVRDKATGEAIPFAAVVVMNNDSKVGATAADIDGNFVIKPLPAGKFTILARVVGYKPFRLKGYIIGRKLVNELDIQLSTKSEWDQEPHFYEYEVPLNKENTQTGPPLTSEDIEKMPRRTPLGVFRSLTAHEYHVAKDGNDKNPGTREKPFKTIRKAADIAKPTNIITVHEGVYREWIDPRNGGYSNKSMVVYQAASGEKVVIKGSEIIDKWEKVDGGVWMVELSNKFFGDYNPYSDVIGVDWYDDQGRDHHTGEVYLNNKSLYEVASLDKVKNPTILKRSTDPDGSLYVWYCEVDGKKTRIYANFHKYNPNKEMVEINVRPACFYPSYPGMNYITVRGFHMSQAACQWSTAADEQIALLGTHWSKGWLIENNVITHSKNIGIALGKDRKSGHRECEGNPDIPGYKVYNNVIVRAYKWSGWNKKNIGSHIVRGNTIYDCEKNGIHGSLGAVFSTIENNHIYNIYTKRQYGGPDIGGIKILGAIDVLIKNNQIHNTYRGLWMDWMAQGTRITRNLLYDNDSDDLFMEVNHGPYVIDNNIFLSRTSLMDWSQGGAYIHNLFGGEIKIRTVSARETPYHKEHSTEIAGLEEIFGGDNRFYNNIFLQTGLNVYNDTKLPMSVHGNLYLNESQPYEFEHEFIRIGGEHSVISVDSDGENMLFKFDSEYLKSWPDCVYITGEQLGETEISRLPFENPDRSIIRINYDYFGKKRTQSSIIPGPFSFIGEYNHAIRLWEE